MRAKLREWLARRRPGAAPPPGRRGRRGRWARAGRRVLLGVAAAYLGLILGPGFLFAYHVERGAFRVYSDAPIGPEIAAVLDRAAAKLARSPLDEPGVIHPLYICNNRLRWGLLAPGRGGAFGVTFLLGRNTVLNRADVAADRVFRDASGRSWRPLSAVIAHERIHALMSRRYGDWTCLRLPAWKKEGYCEYVAGGPSFDPEEGRRLIREGRVENPGPFRYFRYGLMVRYLLDVERLSVDQLVAGHFDEAQVMRGVRECIDEFEFKVE